MTDAFTKKDLKTGDIVILRNGEMGVVITQIDQIMYQNMGMNFLDEFTEELLYDSGYDGRLPEYDIYGSAKRQRRRSAQLPALRALRSRL